MKGAQLPAWHPPDIARVKTLHVGGVVPLARICGGIKRGVVRELVLVDGDAKTWAGQGRETAVLEAERLSFENVDAGPGMMGVEA